MKQTEPHWRQHTNLKRRNVTWGIETTCANETEGDDPTATFPLLRDGSGPIPWGAPVSQGTTGQVARHDGLGQNDLRQHGDSMETEWRQNRDRLNWTQRPMDTTALVEQQIYTEC